MTLVADALGLAQRAQEIDLQAISGVLVEGFDPGIDHPLSWGLDRALPRDVLTIGNSLNGRYITIAQPQLVALAPAPAGGFAPVPASGVPAQPLITNAQDAWNTLSAWLSGNPGFSITTRANDGVDSITDQRTSRLYVTVDLNEWIEFRNRDVVHIVLNNWNGYAPLGVSTVWLRAEAWIQHNRGKSARVYLQGRIAERLQQQLVQGETISPQDFVNTILDADSEAAYSTVHGPC